MTALNNELQSKIETANEQFVSINSLVDGLRANLAIKGSSLQQFLLLIWLILKYIMKHFRCQY